MIDEVTMRLVLHLFTFALTDFDSNNTVRSIQKERN